MNFGNRILARPYISKLLIDIFAICGIIVVIKGVVYMKKNEKIKAFICGMGGLFSFGNFFTNGLPTATTNSVQDAWINVGKYLDEAINNYEKTEEQ